MKSIAIEVCTACVVHDKLFLSDTFQCNAKIENHLHKGGRGERPRPRDRNRTNGASSVKCEKFCLYRSRSRYLMKVFRVSLNTAKRRVRCAGRLTFTSEIDYHHTTVLLRLRRRGGLKRVITRPLSVSDHKRTLSVVRARTARAGAPRALFRKTRGVDSL